MRRRILDDILSPHCDLQMGRLRGYSKLRASTDPRGIKGTWWGVSTNC